MRFEHFGINVPDSRAMADWWVKNLDMRVIRQSEGPAWMRFLADATGRVVMEIYTNPLAAIPNYPEQNPLILHVAFAVEDAGVAIERLVAAGATLVSDEPSQHGRLAMLRDPWGVVVQICQRAVPML